MLYASAVTDGVHNLMAMASEPAPVRMRRVITKLAGVPALVAAARANVTNPPRLLAERGLAMLRGASGLLARDLPLAFADSATPALRDSLRQAATAAIPHLDAVRRAPGAGGDPARHRRLRHRPEALARR
jgi:hypothetical protein